MGGEERSRRISDGFERSLNAKKRDPEDDLRWGCVEVRGAGEGRRHVENTHFERGCRHHFAHPVPGTIAAGSAPSPLYRLMPSPPPPSPKHILRSHRDQIASLYISNDNERLYSGDVTGLVVLTATRTLRALVSWRAHSSAILAAREWEGVDRYIIS